MTALDWNPSPRTLRQFAAIAVAFLGGAAALSHVRGGSWPGQALALGVAGAIGIVALARPQALRLLYVLLSLAVFPIGFVMSHLILLVLFYGVITPLGMLARIGRSDPLSLTPNPPRESYWRSRRRARDKSSYLRQA